MDHDRAEGEALNPQEYTGLKMEVSQWSDAAKALDIDGKHGGRKACLVAATLRPETMYGQTNCFVGPDLKYGVFAVNDKEAYVCTLRAARNMAFQGTFDVQGQVNTLFELPGKDIVGTKIKAPFSINPEVYVLPMESVLATKVRHLQFLRDFILFMFKLQSLGYWRCHFRPLRLPRRLCYPHRPEEEARILQNPPRMVFHRPSPSPKNSYLR